MLENKLYKRSQSKRTPEREIREVSPTCSLARFFCCKFLILFFSSEEKKKGKPISLNQNSEEILCAFSFSSKLASVSIILGVEFHVRVSCFLKLDGSVSGAETGTKFHSIQIKDFINICDLVAFILLFPEL